MNDRQRTEALFFPTMLLNIIDCGVTDQEAEDFKRCRAYLIEANEETLRGCDDKRRRQLMRRVVRLHDALTEEYREHEARVDKVGLMVVYVLQAVLAADYLVLEEGSRLSVAIGAIIEGLGDAFSESRLDASARKHAAKMLAQLQREGYFAGVIFEREAA
ncbi:hypothetical protein LG047_15620 [Methylocystis sp. WRRC1]|uniref:hypothetical protein n=1 Tax=Methylocystis sp. WRRC1 TaxID=1732014 RepID=UPI001D1439FC|nr:hypothetical protein [Methylocystis sp. WRRC1]MCC3246729.1 hypothetical protein [Methylocystis sp. WRRC1]